MSLTNDLQARLDEIQELLARIKSGEFGPEGMSNLDDLTLSGGLTVTGALASSSLALSGALAAASAAIAGAVSVGSLSLTTPLPRTQLATGQADFVIPFYSASAQTTGAKKDAAVLPVACTLVGGLSYLDTAPVGSTFTIDVNKNGTTVFTTQTNRIITADGANAGASAAPPEVTAFAAGDRVSYDIDQIGSGTAGTGLYVSLLFKAVLVA